MKIRRFLILLCALAPLVLIASGCHNASQAQPTVSKESFGYPGMKLGPGYYAQMKKMRAMNGSGGAKPGGTSAPPTKP